MATLAPEQAQLFLDPNVATVGTINADGSAQLSLVWVDWDGSHVVFNTARGRVKPRNIQRDPRVSVLVFDAKSPYTWVAVAGRAELDEAGAAEQIDALARKYTGEGWSGEKDGRVSVRVLADRVTSYGF